MSLISKFGQYKDVKPTIGASKVANINVLKETKGNKGIFEFQKSLFTKTFEVIESTVDSNSKFTTQECLQNYELQNYDLKLDKDSIKVIDSYDNSFVYASYSLGNRKLAGDKVQFIIFNQLQVISCVNATQDCLKFCYAEKAYGNHKLNAGKQETTCRYNRKRNLVFSSLGNFAEITMQVIKLLQSQTKKTVVFRWHEAGDIYDKIYFEKIKKVMFNTTCLYMFYTKSKFVLDEINELNSKKNISLRYSIDESTDKETLKKVENLGCPVYFPVDKQDLKEALENKIISTATTCNVVDNWKEVFTLMDHYEKEKENIELMLEKIKGERNVSKLRSELKENLKKAKENLKRANEMLVIEELKCGKCMKCMNKNINLICLKH